MSKIAFQRAFQELSEVEISYLLENARFLEYGPDEVIMREGDNQKKILVILAGDVAVIRLGKGGANTELTDPLGPGDTVGEMSFIDNLGASATLLTRSEVQVKSIDQNLIDKMKVTDDTFAERFYLSLLYTVIRRLRVLDYKMAFPD